MKKHWLKKLWNNACPEQPYHMEIRFFNAQGADIFYGITGTWTGYCDSKGNKIHAGDRVAFTWNKRAYVTYVLWDSFRNSHFVNGFNSYIDEGKPFTFAELTVVTPWTEIKEGQFAEHLLAKTLTEEGIEEMNKNIRGKGILVTENKYGDGNVLLDGNAEQTVGSPFTLVGLAARLLVNTDKFEPAVPTYDLLTTLFGGSDFHDCPFDPDRIDAEAYGRLVIKWSPKPEHDFYMVREGLGWTPLAYIRTDESIIHRPSSWLDRVTHGYYFCPHLNARFRDTLTSIYTPRKEEPRGEEINRTAVELALTVIWDSERK